MKIATIPGPGGILPAGQELAYYHQFSPLLVAA
jgi:hypothetical protein